ncbi:hypothetical protein TWF281_008649 [Arthrobotrys megalospora]
MKSRWMDKREISGMTRVGKDLGRGREEKRKGKKMGRQELIKTVKHRDSLHHAKSSHRHKQTESMAGANTSLGGFRDEGERIG